jgi:hypothetical protein
METSVGGAAIPARGRAPAPKAGRRRRSFLGRLWCAKVASRDVGRDRTGRAFELVNAEAVDSLCLVGVRANLFGEVDCLLVGRELLAVERHIMRVKLRIESCE